MIFKGKQIAAASFDPFAEIYDSVRPGYPEDLFDEIIGIGGFGPDSLLLEIGAGSGIATVDLAQCKANVVALEPGARLAAIARKRTRHLGNVDVRETTFEEFETQDRFDGVLAFTAYHWIDEGIAYRKVNDLLVSGGYLLLAWNSFFLSDTPVLRKVEQVYHDLLPDIYPEQPSVADVNRGVLSKLRRRESTVGMNETFCLTAIRKYLTHYEYDADTYPQLLNTFPKIAGIEEERRQKFLATVRNTLTADENVVVPVLTTLLVCQRQSDFINAIVRGGSQEG